MDPISNTRTDIPDPTAPILATTATAPAGETQYHHTPPFQGGYVDEAALKEFRGFIGDLPDAVRDEAHWVFETVLVPALMALNGLRAAVQREWDQASEAIQQRHTHIMEQIARGSERLADLAKREAEQLEHLVACNLPGPLSEPSPAAVNVVVESTAPTSEEVAGDNAVSPPENCSGIKLAWQGLLELLAIVATGGLIGMAIGVTTSLLSDSDLRDAEVKPQMIACGLIGIAVAFLLQSAVGVTVRAMTQYLEPGTGSVPRHGAVWIPGVCVVALLVLLSSEVTLEAVALRKLHVAYVSRDHLLDDESTEKPYPFPIYLLVGTVLSTPLSIAKASRAYMREADALRRAILLAKRAEHLRGLRESPEVRSAFALVSRIEQARAEKARVEEWVRSLKDELHALPLRPTVPDTTRKALEAAYAAAVGATHELHEVVAAGWDVPPPGLPPTAFAGPAPWSLDVSDEGLEAETETTAGNAEGGNW